MASLLAFAMVLAVYPLAAQSRDLAAEEEQEWRALPDLPDRADGSVDDLELTAVALAAQLFAVPVDERGTTCSPSRLRVSWDDPGPGFQVGAHLEPVGPEPTAEVADVNGVVLCDGSSYAYMGFEAWRDAGGWRIVAVPFVDEHDDHEDDHEDEHDDEHDEHNGGAGQDAVTPGAHTVAPQGPAAGHAHESGSPTPAPAPRLGPPGAASPAPASGPSASAPPAAPSSAPRTVVDLSSFGSAIEGYAAYEPQRTCSPSAKPGTVALRDQLLSHYDGSRNLGISRACNVGGQSEHKEGRALDWGVVVSRPSEKAAGDAFVAALLATDGYGNRHALARRMGVMYVIWNRQIWSAYRPDAGWRPYSGVSPHTDHVHISLSWDGAMARTSFWAGNVTLEQLDLGQVAVAPASGPVPAGPAPSAAPVSHPATEPAQPSHGDGGHEHEQGQLHDEGPRPKPADHPSHGKGNGEGKAKGRKHRQSEEPAAAAITSLDDHREGDTRELARAKERQAAKEQQAAERAEEQMRREATHRAAARRETERQAAEAAKTTEKAAKETERSQVTAPAPAPAPAPASASAPAASAPAAATAPAPSAPKPGKDAVPSRVAEPKAAPPPKAEKAPKKAGGQEGKGNGKSKGGGD